MSGKTKAISATLRERLQKQRAAMQTSLVIDNKKLTKTRLRVLPCGEDVPGVEFHNLYSQPLNKGCTSPRTFGLPDPVLDAWEQIKRTGTKEEKDAARAAVTPGKEYWMAVLDRTNLGTPAKPNIRVFRAKRTVYQVIMDYMEDDEDGGDLTDPVTGRDVRVQKVQGEQNPWAARVLDAEPIFDGAKETAALLKAIAGFDVREHFFKTNLATLQEMYDALLGEKIPAEIMEQLEASDHCYWPDGDSKSSKPNARVGGGKARPAPAEAEPEGEGTGDEPEAAAEEEPETPEAGEIAVGATVSFEVEGEGKITGTVLEVNEDKGTAEVDAGENTWTVACDDLTVVPEAEAEAEEPEAPAKPAAKPKPKAKAAEPEAEEEEPEEVEEEEAPAAEEPAEEEEPESAKPARATPKPAPKPAAKAPPAAAKRKPVPAKPAAGSLRSRLAKSRK